MTVDQLFTQGYFKLADQVKVHRTPDGGLLFLEENERDPSKRKLIRINETAVDVLGLCDGTRQLSDISRWFVETGQEADESHVTRLIAPFLQEVVQRNFVEILPQPSHTKNRVTGSAKYYVPLHVMIELTETCNLRCVYCYREAVPMRTKRLPTARLLEIMEELAAEGVHGVELTGGEPLTHPDFETILDHAMEHFALVTVLSNGYLIDDALADHMGKYADRLVVQIDLDGSQPELHDQVRGVPGAFAKATSAVRRLHRRGVRTRVAMNVMPVNVHDIEPTLRLAQQLGATWFSYAPVLSIGRGQYVDLTFSPEQAEQLVRLPLEFKKKYPDFFPVLSREYLEKLREKGNCGAGYNSVVMSPQGKVRPCVLLPEEYVVIGDLSTQSVHEVFRSPVTNWFSTLRAPDEKMCNGCDYRYFCQSCFARGILVQQDLDEPCTWYRRNEISRWINLPPKGASFTFCPQVAHHDT